MAKISLLCSFLLLALLFANYNDCQAETEVGVYELKKGDFSVKLTSYGATVLSVILPDRNGKLDDVVLGFESVNQYKTDTTYFGNIVGRVANRIGGAQFTLNGTLYKLVPNEGKNILHGGPKGFSDVIWKVYLYRKERYITFTYDSFDGEQGFPGDLSVSVTYMLVGSNNLAVKMVAKPLNKPTPVNLALHAYWNLGGHTSGDILSHTIQLFGSYITPVDDELIPSGEIVPVEGTAYDFLEPRKIGSKLNELADGYDINYVLKDLQPGHLKMAAIVQDTVSGRKMKLWTNKPGVQFYTSNKLDNVTGKGGFVYGKHAGLCLETQGFPDSVNQPNFPSQIVSPGQTYEHIMIYRFTAE